MIFQATNMISTFILTFVISTSGSCRNAEEITDRIKFPQQPLRDQVHWKKRHYDDMFPFPLPFSTIVSRTEKRSNKQQKILQRTKFPMWLIIN